MKEKKTTWHTLTVLAMWSIIVCSLFSVTAKAQTATFSGPQPKHEVRAVWLTTIGGLDWPHCYAQSARSIEKQKQEMRHILDRLQQAGINTVLLQTRIRATTIYPSQLEPWDGCLSGCPGKSPGYDATRMGGRHTRGQMGRFRMPHIAPTLPQAHKEDWPRRLHGS